MAKGTRTDENNRACVGSRVLRARRLGIAVLLVVLVGSTVGFGGVASARNVNQAGCANTSSGVAHSDNAAYGWCF